MGHLKKGQLTKPVEYAKHFRKYKRFFWHIERKAQKKDIETRLREEARPVPPEISSPH